MSRLALAAASITAGGTETLSVPREAGHVRKGSNVCRAWLALEAFALFALVAVLWVVAGDEVVEVAAFKGVFFKGEMQIRAQVVNPELQRPVQLALHGFPARVCG